MSEYRFSIISHTELRGLIKKTLEERSSLLIIGRSGIGKTFSVVEVCKKYAEEIGKEFILWNDASEEVKKDVQQNPEKYYILVIYPMSMSDIGEFKVPSIKNESWFRFLVNESIYVLSRSEGCLFLDEVNLLQSRSLQNLLYQIVLDNRVGNVKLKCARIAAGNLSEDRAGTSFLAPPLVRRFKRRVILEMNSEEFLKYAQERDFDKRIIAFLLLNKNRVYEFDTESYSSIAIPATWEQLSNAIKDADDEEAIDEAYYIVGPTVASEFEELIKLMKKFDPIELVKNPEKIKDLERREKVVALTVITRNIKKFGIEDLVNFITSIEPEMALMLFHLLSKDEIAELKRKKLFDMLFQKNKELVDKLANILIELTR